MHFGSKALFTILLIGSALTAHPQYKSKNDSLIYLTIIKSVIPDTAKYILIINKTVTYDHQTDPANIIDSMTTDPDEILSRKYEWEAMTGTPFDSMTYNTMFRYYLGKHETKKINYRFHLPFKIYYYQKQKDTVKYWERLNKKHADRYGTLSFSQIFYSTDHSIAAVYYSLHSKNGKGAVLCFQKINGEWVVKFGHTVWHN